MSPIEATVETAEAVPAISPASHGTRKHFACWRYKCEFPKTRDTFLGFPKIKFIASWGLYWDPLILGNYQIALSVLSAVGSRAV